MINDGGPAFPVPQGLDYESDTYNQAALWDSGYGGMSLRDWFAGLAMMGFCSHQDIMKKWFPNIGPPAEEEECIANYAYEQADAMLKAREKQGGGERED